MAMGLTLRLASRLSLPTRTIMHSQKQQTLAKVATALDLELQPPILLPSTPVPSRTLSLLQKQQLGLFIPPSPFNPRLTQNAQHSYLPALTSQLYALQLQTLPTMVKILQDAEGWRLANTGWTLDQYINLIYKDIYARYLVSKGAGIEWLGFGAEAGVLHPYSSSECPPRSEDLLSSASRLMEFISLNSGQIQMERAIGLYSYMQGEFVHPQLVQSQPIKKMSYNMRIKLSRFGRFEEEFAILEEKHYQAYLLVIGQSLQQAIAPEAVCLKEGVRMQILRKVVEQEDDGKVGEYLFLPGQTYKQHESYFLKSGYQKHKTVLSEHLHGMECGYKFGDVVHYLPIIGELEEYDRPAGCYLVSSNCNLPDFERIVHYSIPHRQPYLTPNGTFFFSQENSININDPFLDRKIQAFLKHKGVELLDMYGVTDQYTYYHKHTKEVMRFRLGQKLMIDVSQQVTPLIEALSANGTIIEESKITIPSFPRGKKPRQRRRFRKERKEMLEQITEDPSLEEAIGEIIKIAVSSLSPSSCRVPVFMRDGRVLAYESVLSGEELERMLEGKLTSEEVGATEKKGVEVHWVNGSASLMTGLAYISHLQEAPRQVRNVLIQPQSAVQDLVALALHLNFLANKSRPGRRSRVQSTQGGRFTLIKLHPTLKEEMRGVPLTTLLRGVVKGNGQEQYGWGWEAMRMWTARNDDYRGERAITDELVKREMGVGQSIRKCMWELMGIVPAQFLSTSDFSSIWAQPSLYLSRFILDMLDCYLLEMESAYNSMDLLHAYQLTQQFFKLILHRMYITPLRKRIIAYPNLQENRQHFAVMGRIIAATIPAIAPLLPFTAYHLSRKTHLQWPDIIDPKRSYQSIPTHSKMTKLWVKVRSKLQLNKLKHAHLYCPSLKDSFSLRDLQLFFDVDSATHSTPSLAYRSCSLKLSPNNPVTDDARLVMFESQEHCIRCDPKSVNQEYLCGSCVGYLEEEIEEGLRYHRQIEKESSQEVIDRV